MVTVAAEERMDTEDVEAVGRTLTTIGVRPGAGG